MAPLVLPQPASRPHPQTPSTAHHAIRPADAHNTTYAGTPQRGMSHELADAVRELALVQLAAAQRAHATWQEAAAALETSAAAAGVPLLG